MCMGVLLASVSVYHVCVPTDLGGQERESHHLELELQFVSDYLGTGNQTWVHWKRSQYA